MNSALRPSSPASEEKREVTIVVTTRNSGRTLRQCLESIRAQSVACELIVVDNSSDDSTEEIACEIADIVMHTGPERSVQRNVGAEAAHGTIVGFIDSDMVLGPSVVAEAVQLLKEGAAGVIIPEVSFGSSYWSRVRAYERSFYAGDDDVEAARFFPAEVFAAIGGFDKDMTGGEDWDLTIRARRMGSIGRTSSKILHDEGELDFLGACRKKAYYAPGLRVFVAKHGISSLQSVLSRPWMTPKSILSPLGIGLALLKTGEAVSVLYELAKSRLAAGK